MDNILRCSGYLPTTTLIHNIFIENYMLSANGSYVKVYLYLSKCIQTGEKDLSISTLADRMDNTEKDVLRALHYWEKHNLIHLSKDESGITGIEMLNPEIPVKSNTSGIHEPVSAIKPVEEKTSARTNGTEAACTDENTYTKTTKENTTDKKNEFKEVIEAKEVKGTDKNTQNNRVVEIKTTLAQTERLAKDEEFIWTCRVIESYVNRPLISGEVELISYLYDSLGFSSDLLLYLYEYGISHGSTHVKYIERIAISWHNQDIKSPEDAKQVSSEYNATYTAISKALGFKRTLLIAEKELVDRWLNTWNMDLAVVLEACNRTVLKTQSPTLGYVQSIINNWHETHVHTLQDVQKADATYEQNKTKTKTQPKNNVTVVQKNTQSKNKFHQFHQREVSQEELDKLEKELLAR